MTEWIGWITWVPFLNALWTSFFVVTLFGPLAGAVIAYDNVRRSSAALGWVAAVGSIIGGYIVVWGIYRATGIPPWARYLDNLAQQWVR